MEAVVILTAVMLEDMLKKLQLPNQNTRLIYQFWKFYLSAQRLSHSDGTV
jgi:hypothetical protein